MEEKLFDIIKKARGSLLAIGVSNVCLIEAIENNENIKLCYLLENKNLNNNGKFSFKGKKKKVNIKKLKKRFSKKKTDTIICEYNSINKFLRNFVPGSIYINNDKLYIYGKMTDEDIEEIKSKYKRYTKEIEVEKLQDDVLVTINNKNTKNKFFRGKIYYIIDLLESLIDFMTALLIN